MRSHATADTQSYATAASLDQLLVRPKTGESVSTVDTARTSDSEQMKLFVVETLQGRNALTAINVAAAKFAATRRTPGETKEFQNNMLNEARGAIQRHVSAESLAPVLRRSTPSRHLATLAGMLCLIHNVQPPSWNAAKRLLSRPDFIEHTLDIHPKHIPSATKDTVQELFRLTHVASVYRKQPKAVSVLIWWCGVVVQAPELGLAGPAIVS